MFSLTFLFSSGKVDVLDLSNSRTLLSTGGKFMQGVYRVALLDDHQASVLLFLLQKNANVPGRPWVESKRFIPALQPLACLYCMSVTMGDMVW